MSRIPHYLATEIAVSTLSPVAITVRISQSRNVSIIFVVAIFSLFSKMSKPRKLSSLST